MPPKENPERACEECIHFFACSKQCGVPMAQGSATGCECYETVKSSAAYFAGTLDGAKQEIPSRLREIAEADKAGRLVVLPCKMGDTVYMIEHIFDIDNGVCDEICARKVIGYGGNNLNKLWLIGSGGICNVSIFVSEFGKTVFLTREEAERAMQEMEGKKDGKT